MSRPINCVRGVVSELGVCIQIDSKEGRIWNYQVRLPESLRIVTWYQNVQVLIIRFSLDPVLLLNDRLRVFFLFFYVHSAPGINYTKLSFLSCKLSSGESATAKVVSRLQQLGVTAALEGFWMPLPPTKTCILSTVVCCLLFLRFVCV